MKQRIFTGVAIAAGLLVIFFLSEYVFYWVYDLTVIVIMCFAAYEISHAISHKYSSPMNFLLYVYIVVGYIAFRVVHSFYGRQGITSFFAVLGLLVIAAIVYNMFSERKNLSNVISTLFCMVYPLSLMVYMLALNYVNVGTEVPASLASNGWVYDPWVVNDAASSAFTPNYRAIAVIAVIFCSSCTDVFALFVGITFKGPKIAPHISPKKTVSGSIGGLIGGMFGAGIIMSLGYTNIHFMGLTPLSDVVWKNIVLYMALGLGIALFTELGDLIASYIKRYCEIKDYGDIFPGHGGMLDRIDGMILASIFAYAYFTVILMIQSLLTGA